MIEGLQSDRDAVYAQVIKLEHHLNSRRWSLRAANAGNGKYIRDLHTPGANGAYGGTCTAGKNEDMDMYAAVLADALKQGKRVASSVQFWIRFFWITRNARGFEA